MHCQLYQTVDERQLFQRCQNIPENESDAQVEILLDRKRKYQTIDGFGASFTDSAAYLIHKVLPKDKREEAMKRLFDPNDGIGLSLLRNPMGASDYARSIYSYDDLSEGETDSDLKKFSIQHDKESILPLTKWAKTLNPELQVFATPWSAPGWMKDSGKMVSGKLLKKNYGAYANYFLKFIQACAKEGVVIDGVTPQNEPLFEPKHYPSMEMLVEEEIDFVKNYLKPTFVKNNVQTKIFGYDHNWDRLDYPLSLLDEAAEAFDGIAWHWYGGRPINQARVAQFYPGKECHFTEGSGGDWIPAFEPAFSNLLRNGIDVLRNGSRSFILWNIALDENNGPTVPNFGKSTCRGLLKVDQSAKTLTYTLDFYGLAHFSKFVRPGACRIESTENPMIKNVVFENLDGSLVMVAWNDSTKKQQIRIVESGSCLKRVGLPPKSANTFIFR